MDTTPIDQALARLEKALQRAENGAGMLGKTPTVDAREHESLLLRHDQLKETVANSLKQLDEILAGMGQ